MQMTWTFMQMKPRGEDGSVSIAVMSVAVYLHVCVFQRQSCRQSQPKEIPDCVAILEFVSGYAYHLHMPASLLVPLA